MAFYQQFCMLLIFTAFLSRKAAAGAAGAAPYVTPLVNAGEYLTCPNDFTKVGTMCYTCDSERRTYADAQTHCESLGGNLASIHSQEQFTYIWEHCAVPEGVTSVLIGLNVLNETWSDGSAMDYKPNDTELMTSGYCGAVKGTDKWGGASCTLGKLISCAVAASPEVLDSASPPWYFWGTAPEPPPVASTNVAQFRDVHAFTRNTTAGAVDPTKLTDGDVASSVATYMDGTAEHYVVINLGDEVSISDIEVSYEPYGCPDDWILYDSMCYGLLDTIACGSMVQGSVLSGVSSPDKRVVVDLVLKRLLRYKKTSSFVTLGETRATANMTYFEDNYIGAKTTQGSTLGYLHRPDQQPDTLNFMTYAFSTTASLSAASGHALCEILPDDCPVSGLLFGGPGGFGRSFFPSPLYLDGEGFNVTVAGYSTRMTFPVNTTVEAILWRSYPSASFTLTLKTSGGQVLITTTPSLTCNTGDDSDPNVCTLVYPLPSVPNFSGVFTFEVQPIGSFIRDVEVDFIGRPVETKNGFNCPAELEILAATNFDPSDPANGTISLRKWSADRYDASMVVDAVSTNTTLTWKVQDTPGLLSISPNMLILKSSGVIAMKEINVTGNGTDIQCPAIAIPQSNVNDTIGSPGVAITVECFIGYATVRGDQTYDLLCDTRGVWQNPLACVFSKYHLRALPNLSPTSSSSLYCNWPVKNFEDTRDFIRRSCISNRASVASISQVYGNPEHLVFQQGAVAARNITIPMSGPPNTTYRFDAWVKVSNNSVNLTSYKLIENLSANYSVTLSGFLDGTTNTYVEVNTNARYLFDEPHIISVEYSILGNFGKLEYFVDGLSSGIATIPIAGPSSLTNIKFFEETEPGVLVYSMRYAAATSLPPTTDVPETWLFHRTGPARRSCLEWLQAGYEADGVYVIQPNGADAIPVRCSMKESSATVELTAAKDGHVTLAATIAQNIKFEERRSNASIRAVADNATYCQQSVYFSCERDNIDINIIFADSTISKLDVASQDVRKPCTGGCACSASSSSSWVYDTGYITEKEKLPITGIKLKSTTSTSLDYKIGALVCVQANESSSYDATTATFTAPPLTNFARTQFADRAEMQTSCDEVVQADSKLGTTIPRVIWVGDFVLPVKCESVQKKERYYAGGSVTTVLTAQISSGDWPVGDFALLNELHPTSASQDYSLLALSSLLMTDTSDGLYKLYISRVQGSSQLVDLAATLTITNDLFWTNQQPLQPDYSRFTANSFDDMFDYSPYLYGSANGCFLLRTGNLTKYGSLLFGPEANCTSEFGLASITHSYCTGQGECSIQNGHISMGITTTGYNLYCSPLHVLNSSVSSALRISPGGVARVDCDPGFRRPVDYATTFHVECRDGSLVDMHDDTKELKCTPYCPRYGPNIGGFMFKNPDGSWVRTFKPYYDVGTQMFLVCPTYYLPDSNGNNATCEGPDTWSVNPLGCTALYNIYRWGPWIDVGICSKTCGKGSLQQTRVCNPPPLSIENATDLNCTGLNNQQVPCNTQDCPRDGLWGTWSEWGMCSATCSGKRFRRRKCEGRVLPGADCTGGNVEDELCQPLMCPVDGVWSQWSAYSACSLTCGVGTQSRSRSCNDPAPQDGGAPCAGNSTSQRICKDTDCPPVVNTAQYWDAWAPFSPCSTTCGPGNKTRSRVCVNESPTQNCTGPSNDTATCNENTRCPVDGGFTVWGEWTNCSKECGNGTQERMRECTNPLPQYGGASCQGNIVESVTCNTNTCIPVHGNWSAWADATACDVTCGNGSLTQTRRCDNPAPKYNGDPCAGQNSRAVDCSTGVACPATAFWGSWSAWGTCSATCDTGLKQRTRVCTPSGPGATTDCPGSPIQMEACSVNLTCPVDGRWGNWGTWGTCATTCGIGVYNRNRTCTGQTPGGKNCSGDATHIAQCFLRNCPIDGNWTDWSNWGACSVFCGNGTQERRRSCRNPAPEYGGAACSGLHFESKSCTGPAGPCLGPCRATPEVGVWGNWTVANNCSKPCGNGTLTLSRDCLLERPDCTGGACPPGAAYRQEPCNEEICPPPVWSAWSSCSTTCGSGINMRSRDCDTNYVLLSDCSPINGAMYQLEFTDCFVNATCPTNGTVITDCPYARDTIAGLLWLVTTPGDSVTQTCPGNYSGDVTRRCDLHGHWGQVDTLGCARIGNARTLAAVAEVRSNISQLENAVNSASDRCQGSELSMGSDLEFCSTLSAMLADIDTSELPLRKQEDITEKTMNIEKTVMAKTELMMNKIQLDKGARAQSYTGNIEVINKLVKKTCNITRQYGIKRRAVTSPTMDFYCNTTSPSQFPTEFCCPPRPVYKPKAKKGPYEEVDEPPPDLTTRVCFDRAIVERTLKGYNRAFLDMFEPLTVICNSYTKLPDYILGRSSSSNKRRKRRSVTQVQNNPTTQTVTRVVNARIIYADLIPTLSWRDFLDRPVHLTFYHIAEGYGALCVQLVPKGSNLVWAPGSCETLETDTVFNSTSCRCSSAGTFALMTYLGPEPIYTEEVIDGPLWQVVASCVVCIVLIGLALLHTVLDGLHTDRALSHKMMAFGLWVAEIFMVLIAVDHWDNDNSKTSCVLMAAFFLYFWLVAAAWVVGDSISLLTMVWGRDKQRSTSGQRKQQFGLLGWALPALVVSVALIARFKTFTNPKYCWISNDFGLYGAFYGPVCILLVTDIILRVCAALELKKQERVTGSLMLPMTTYARAVLGMALLEGCMVVVGWFICPTFMNDGPEYRWLLCFTNIGLGVVVFIVLIFLCPETLYASKKVKLPPKTVTFSVINSDGGVQVGQMKYGKDLRDLGKQQAFVPVMSADGNYVPVVFVNDPSQRNAYIPAPPKRPTASDGED